MEDKDIQKIVEQLHELLLNDIQEIKYELISEIRSVESATQQNVTNGVSCLNRNLKSIEGQMYNLRRV